MHESLHDIKTNYWTYTIDSNINIISTYLKVFHSLTDGQQLSWSLDISFKCIFQFVVKSNAGR